MKKFILTGIVAFSINFSFGQTIASKLPAVDKSPMDMAYYPANFPVLKIQDKANEPLLARVIYSRPLRSGRTVFGELVEYGKVWRLGANEATEIELFKEARVGGKRIPKGKYTIYALVNPTNWTLILNKETDTWGAFKYDEKKDVARINVPVENLSEAAEAFTIFFDKIANGTNMVIVWDNVKVAMPVLFK